MSYFWHCITAFFAGSIIPSLLRTYPNARVTAIARDAKHDAAILAAGVHAVLHFEDERPDVSSSVLYCTGRC